MPSVIKPLDKVLLYAHLLTLDRSAPEVISANRYSHASDVWAFGILSWELYTAFDVGHKDRMISLPYYNIKPDKVNMLYA